MMGKIKKILDKLNEGKNIGILYHFSTILGVLSIVRSNEIKTNEVHDSDIYRYFSTTRDRYFAKNVKMARNKNYSSGVMLDGNSLSDICKIVPYNGMHDKIIFSDDGEVLDYSYSDLQHSDRNEREERVYVHKKYLSGVFFKGINKYIKKVIIYRDLYKKHLESGMGMRTLNSLTDFDVQSLDGMEEYIEFFISDDFIKELEGKIGFDIEYIK